MWVDGDHRDPIIAVVHYGHFHIIKGGLLMQSFAGFAHKVLLSWVPASFVGVESGIFVASD